MNDLISVIIPCYGEYWKFLAEALESLKKQTYQNFEVIFDSTPNYIKARNEAIKKSKGKYLVCLDADDRLMSEYFEKAISLIDENSIIAPAYRYFDEEFVYIPFLEDGFKKANRIIIASMFPKSLWERVGGFDEEMDFYEDWLLWAIAEKLGYQFKIIPEVMVEIRSWNSTSKKLLPKHQYYYQKLLEKLAKYEN